MRVRNLRAFAVMLCAPCLGFACSPRDTPPDARPATRAAASAPSEGVALQRLLTLVPPPSEPAGLPGAPDWAAIERELGTPLPSDYKVLVQNYGRGAFSEFLWPLAPFSPNENLALLPQVKWRLEAERDFREQFPDQVSFPIFPESGGLLPWAFTDNGDTLYWLTQGSADEWVTVLNDSRSSVYTRYEVGCVEFVLAWLSGELDPMPFAGVFDPGGPSKSFETNPTSDG